MGLVIITLIILGGILMTHTAAVIAVGNNARALDVARQTSVTVARLDKVVVEAAQNTAGISFQPSVRSFPDELTTTLAEAPTGAAAVSITESPTVLEKIRTFPDFGGAPAALSPPSAELLGMANAELRDLIGSSVSETSTVAVKFSISRTVLTTDATYGLQVSLKLVGVPLTRYGVLPYTLPAEIGSSAGSPSWPSTLPAAKIGPMGLAPGRDPAHIATLETGSNRPGHYRRMAAISEACQYVFSSAYVQRVADYSGGNHFVQVGGATNPLIDGGNQSGSSYRLDVGQYGRGRLGPLDDTKDAGVFWAATAGTTLQITDSGGSTSPVLIVVAGPSDVALGRMTVQIQSDITRPIVIVGYNVEITAPASVTINGALLLDKDCFVAASAGPLTTGHLSYWDAGSVNPDAFRIGAMPPSAELIAPRVIYAVTERSSF